MPGLHLILSALTLVLAAPAAAADNAACQECHGVSGLVRFDDRTGERLDYSIDPAAYESSVHGEASCVACHDVGYEGKLPHFGPRMQPRFLCVRCHEKLGEVESLKLPDRREDLLRGAHGDHGKDRLTCHDCHDPHRFQLLQDRPEGFVRIAAGSEICLGCHGAGERQFGHEALPDAESRHGPLPNAGLHLSAVSCVTCHAPEGDGTAHDVLPASESLGDCTQCHRRDDPRWAADHPDGGPFASVYVVGSSRSPWLDRASQGGFLLLLLGVAAHRWRRGRTGAGPRRMTGAPGLRAWHRAQGVLVVGLLLSGLSLHYGDSGAAPLSFRTAVRVHDVLGVANLALWVAFAVANARSGHVRHYLQRLAEVPAQLPPVLRYYAWGTFHGEPPPGPVSADEAFSPLQKAVYAGVMYGALPLSAATGTLLLFPGLAPQSALGQAGIWPVAFVHLASAYAISLFAVAHLYMVSSDDAEPKEQPDAPPPEEPG